ncbi:MAG TPA: hypothetical protein VHS78_01795 [Candidatus Elarobacter sp.]|jgi:hypothetical protein|nr:hypothetical protein [Candidatus Elarobacter sp.]
MSDQAFMQPGARVFIVTYERPSDDWLKIGLFTSRERAESAVAALRAQPGFVSNPNGFRIDETPLDTVF